MGKHFLPNMVVIFLAAFGFMVGFFSKKNPRPEDEEQFLIKRVKKPQ